MAIKRSVHSRQLFTFELQWKTYTMLHCSKADCDLLYLQCSKLCVNVSVCATLCLYLAMAIFFSVLHSSALAHLVYLLNIRLKNRKLSCAGAATPSCVYVLSVFLGCRFKIVVVVFVWKKRGNKSFQISWTHNTTSDIILQL